MTTERDLLDVIITGLLLAHLGIVGGAVWSLWWPKPACAHDWRTSGSWGGSTYGHTHGLPPTVLPTVPTRYCARSAGRPSFCREA